MHVVAALNLLKMICYISGAAVGNGELHEAQFESVTHDVVVVKDKEKGKKGAASSQVIINHHCLASPF